MLVNEYTKHDIYCHLLFEVMQCFYLLILNVHFYQVKTLMFYNVQTTKLTFVECYDGQCQYFQQGLVFLLSGIESHDTCSLTIHFKETSV